MKRKIKKLLRLLIVFMSCFALVCFCLPTKALAQENDGDTYSYSSNNLSGKVIFRYVAKVAESLGYTIPSLVEDFSPELVQFFSDYGVNTEGINGYVWDAIAPDINIDLHNQNLLEFFSDIKNWDLNNLDNEKDQFLLDVIFSDSFYMDNQMILDAYAKKESLNPRTIDNINKFVRYKAYALSRGSTRDISGSSVSGDFFLPTSITFYCNVYFDPVSAGANVTGNKTISQILGSEVINYSAVPFVSGSINYDSGSFTYSAVNEGFNGVQSDIYRFVFTVDGGNMGEIISVSGDSVINVAAISDCSVSSGLVITKTNTSSQIQFVVYTDSPYSGSFKIHWSDYVVGGIDAPSTPVYWKPDNDDIYDNDIYNYITTETDRILDELDINDIGKILEMADDYGWFTFPLQFYNDIAEIFLDEYSSEFIFDIDDIDLSFVADGLVFPARRFSFNPLADLDGWAFYLFDMLRYIVAFGYFWALVMWGRSLILRIGSDTVHQDYED